MSFIHDCVEEEDHQKRVDITWNIANIISVLNDNKGKKYDLFVSEENHLKNNFKLKIKYLGRNKDMLEIYYLFPKTVFLKAILKLELKDYKQRTLVTNGYRGIQSNNWQYLTALFKRDIINCENQYISRNGNLSLVFIFKIITNIVVPEKNPKDVLSNDFQNLLDSGLYSDVIIKSAEDKEFCVHKAILAGRSTVFKAHFDHNTLECHTNIIESPLETDLLSEVLTYIYTGKCPRVDDIPGKLLAAAEFYQLDTLKSLCEQALQERLTVENVIEKLEFAELYSAKTLQKLTLEFIKDGHSQNITKTEGWAKVKSIELIKSLYEYILDVEDFNI